MKHIAVYFFIILLVTPSVFQDGTIGQHIEDQYSQQILVPMEPSSKPALSLQSLINNATAYDVIYVPYGIYKEHIVINKPISLIGETNTIIDGSYQNTILEITSDNVVITNIQFHNSGGNNHDSCIFIDGDNVTISDCVFYHSKQAIFSNRSSRLVIHNCSFFQFGRAIHLYKTNHVFIQKSFITQTAMGIFTHDSTNITINASIFENNGLTLFSKKSSEITIINSYVNDNSDNHGGLFFDKSNNIDILRCQIDHNGIGINFEQSENIRIIDSNLINNTHFAILLRNHSKYIYVKSCSIHNNKRYGIYCYDNTLVFIANNNIYGNLLHGLYSEKPVFFLSHNWWGHEKGPSLFSNEEKEQITLNNLIFHYKKWSSIPNIMTSISPINIIDITRPSHSASEILSKITGKDTDMDGAPDWWEEKWGYNPTIYHDHFAIDTDNDGLNNIEECYTDQWGSNPQKKDIFLEIDWMESLDYQNTNKPSPILLQQIIDVFADNNITLHVDEGTMGQGGEIDYQDTSDFSLMIDIYWEHFLNNNPQNPRKGIFHYAIISNECADVSYPFFGWHNLDSIAISSLKAKQISPQYPLQMIINGGIVHQLGSNLGLLVETHQGNDNWQASKIGTFEWIKYHNYKSSMHYLYKYRLLSYSDGTHGIGDHNDWEDLDLGFFKNTSFSINST